MKIFRGKLEDLVQNDDLSIALGTFDGVHRGHQAIIKEAVDIGKEKNIKSAVLTFDIHPRIFIPEKASPKIITDNNSKAKIIESLGVDYLFFVNFDESLRDLEYDRFLKYLVNGMKAKCIVCGYNYKFGKSGLGNTEILKQYQNILHYDLKIVDRISFNNEKISSTIIREKISKGDIKDANRLLGYSLVATGEVVSGKCIGHTIGFPTANILIDDNLCFKNGVYITLAHIDNSIYPSITNIGYTPTIQSNYRVMETNIFNFSDDIYGKTITIEFLEFLRGETKFNSLEELVKRVNKDILTSKKYFEHTVYNT